MGEWEGEIGQEEEGQGEGGERIWEADVDKFERVMPFTSTG